MVQLHNGTSNAVPRASTWLWSAHHPHHPRSVVYSSPRLSSKPRAGLPTRRSHHTPCRGTCLRRTRQDKTHPSGMASPSGIILSHSMRALGAARSIAPRVSASSSSFLERLTSRKLGILTNASASLPPASALTLLPARLSDVIVVDGSTSASAAEMVFSSRLSSVSAFIFGRASHRAAMPASSIILRPPSLFGAVLTVISLPWYTTFAPTSNDSPCTSLCLIQSVSPSRSLPAKLRLATLLLGSASQSALIASSVKVPTPLATPQIALWFKLRLVTLLLGSISQTA
mmetsp:Transcript_29998/g.73830  ORF Transcript_29998/g.73830 Transcript_29998/m.73830 type:complete len:286 (+) Transcript_29998:255-1112(+)